MMSLIRTGEYYESTNEWELLCECCKRSVGRATAAECGHLATRGEPVRCFDCDGFMADMVPQHLVPEEGEEIVTLGLDKQLGVAYSFTDKVRPSGPFDVRTGVRLSSSPYFHAADQDTNKASG